MVKLLELPQEILISILCYVSFKDLLHFVLVSKTAHDKASETSLWKHVKLKTFFNEETLGEFLKIERYSKVQILEIERKGQVIILEFYRNPLLIQEQEETPEDQGSFLAAYFKNLKKLTLISCMAECADWNNIFHQIIQQGKLKELTVKTWLNCASTPPDMLATAIAKLEVVKMVETSLNHDQLTAIFSAPSSPSLTEADFSGSQVQDVSGSVIGKFAAKLRKFSLGSVGSHKCMMAPREAESFFQEILSSQTLQYLDLSKCNLRSVDDSLFTEAVGKLNTLKLEWAKLTREQTAGLFSRIAQQSCLQQLAFVGNHVDHVQPQLIGKAVGKLTKVTIENSWMTGEVFKEIFQHALNSTTLKELKIGGDSFGGDFSLVCPEVLGKVVGRLRAMRLKDLSLSQDQCMAAMAASKLSPNYIDFQMLKVNIIR
eukprot:GFUD01009516.1.p1 GENE.GFUD01009516.1~~GFUD01009516.1.p1  ORF type:complete len:429 (+),score=87.64 GFUD01009516.1:205-1491(+)